MNSPKPQLVVERNFNDCTKCGAEEAQLTTVTERGEEMSSRLLALSSFLPREWVHVKVRQVDDKNGSIFLEVMHV